MRSCETNIVLMQGPTRTILLAGLAEISLDVGDDMGMGDDLGLELTGWVAAPANANKAPIRLIASMLGEKEFESSVHVSP